MARRIYHQGKLYASTDAADLEFNVEDSNLEATTVAEALTEINTKVDTCVEYATSSDISSLLSELLED